MSSNTDAINTLQASDPTTSQRPRQGTTYTSPTNVEYLEPPPSIQRRPQNLPEPTLPTKSQHLQHPSTPQANPTATPRLRVVIPSPNRRQPQYRHKPKPQLEPVELFKPLDPYRLTISPIDAVRSFITQMGDWAMQGLPHREGRAPQEVGNDLEQGPRPQPGLEEASVSAETEPLQEQPRGKLSDGTTYFPAPSTSLPNLPETYHSQHNATLSPLGHGSYNLVDGAPGLLPISEKKAMSSPLIKVSVNSGSKRKEKIADSKPLSDPPLHEAYTSPKPPSEPEPHHTPLIPPPLVPSQIPGTSHPDNIKHQPPPSFWEQIIRQIYRYLLLRLPSLYFNRVGRVFLEAHMSKPDLELLISRATATHAIVVAAAIALGVGGSDIPTSQGREEGRRRFLDTIAGTPQRSHGTPRNPSEREGMTEGSAGNRYGTVEYGASPSPMLTPLGPLRAEASQMTLADSVPPGEQWTVPHVPWSLARFKEEWENFVNRLINEWKTLNILSALLLATLITVLQIQDVTQNVVTRTIALLSLISALMSLIFGCIYILRFSAMRTMRKAAKWAQEARLSTSDIFWNVWVFLALPACWLAWSVIFFCVTVICFIWTSGDSETLDAPVTPPPDSASSNPSGDQKPTPGVVLGLRVVETLFFGVGVVYFVMVIRTFRDWGSIGAIPLRAGDIRHPDVHRLKEDNVTSPLPARRVPGGTGQGPRFVVEPMEGESSQCPRPTDQHTDTDEKHCGRSPENKDTAPIQVIVSRDEMHWEKERERLYGTVSSKDNLPEVGEKAAYVGALDFETGRTPEGSSVSDVLLRSPDATSPPTSAFGASTHD